MSNLATNALGRTGLTVTRLAAGGHFTNGPTGHDDIPRRVRELNHLIDAGVTYFDVQWEPEEVATAEVMKTRREEMTIAWPLHGVTKLGADVTAEYITDYCDDHRQRFGIEHVDILLWVGLELYPETQEQVMAEVRKGFQTLQRDGFCDHLAFSCHHSPEMAAHAIENFDDFAVMMVPFGPLVPRADEGALALARAKGVGTVGMKPFGGGGGMLNRIYAGQSGKPELAQWEGSGQPFQAAIRWVLRNEHLDCTVPGCHSIQEIDEIISASTQPFGPADEEILQSIETALAGEHLGADMAKLLDRFVRQQEQVH